MKNKNVLIISLFLLFSMLACSLFSQSLPKDDEPVIEIKDDGSVEVNATAAAEAEFAVQTQIAGIEATQQSLVEKVEATAQALRPTNDSSDLNVPQVTPTPIDPKSLQTPPPAGVTTVSVSVNTNCRSGPGVNYERMDIVYVGQDVEVLGVDTSGAYYIVRSPNGSTCWLWSHYATLHGEQDSLVVMTPPAPPQTIVIDDWQDEIFIKISEEFSWQGHWVTGAPGGQSHADWYNAQIGDCDECWRYKSQEIDIARSGDYLEIVMTDHSYWFDGSTAISIHYGLAQVSEDNSMAVGSFYLIEQFFSDGYTDTWAWDNPILLFQNGNPNQIVGSYSSWPQCAAREGAAFPVPCTWP